MNNRPIGVLDSGVGGLTIWQEIVKQLPSESTIYIGDSRNCPYGDKDPEEIYTLAHRLVNHLIEKDCKLIVLACNTITVNCLDRLRVNFPQTPIIGTVPVVKTAAEKAKEKRLRLRSANNNFSLSDPGVTPGESKGKPKIGILSTVRTAESKYQQHLIQQFANDCEVVNIGTDELVPIVEGGGWKVENRKILQKVLRPFIEKKVDVLALGCSHFPFLKQEMQEILGPDVLLLDSAGAIARQVQRVLEHNNAFSDASSVKHLLSTTGDRGQFQRIVQIITQDTVTVEQVTL